MGSLEQIEQRVKELYEAKDPGRADWADWLYDHHVSVVADKAAQLAKRFDANVELSRAAGLLHDVADVKMPRSAHHEAESLKMARELLEQAGFTDAEIRLVVDDAIARHSCHGEVRPHSLEGKVLATADALAHLQTDFYLQAIWFFADEMPLTDIKAWTLTKLERDFNNKILFEPVKAEARADYELLKQLFSR